MISNLKQGSQEWLEIRKKCITSTDAAIINETNKFRGNSPYKLWQRKLGLIDLPEVNNVMIEGSELEKEALQWFNRKNNVNLLPAVVFHKKNEWMMASLDGFNMKLKYIVEIKCGEKTYEKAYNDYIPPYYYDQIQHSLACSDKDLCYYLCYRREFDPLVIEVKKDEDYVNKLINKEKEFYDYLKNMTPPPLSEKDYLEIDGKEENIIANKWKEAKLVLEDAKKNEKEWRQKLVDVTDDGNCIFSKANVKIDRITNKGNIDWKKVCVSFNISQNELDKYRKESIGYPKITILDHKDL